MTPPATPQTFACHGDTFRLYLDEATIQQRIAELGAQLSRDYAGKELVVIGVLSGAFVFLADLVRASGVSCSIDFVKLASYGAGTQSSGKVQEVLKVSSDLRSRHVLIVEDIVDTGRSIQYLLERIERQAPASVRVATLLHKPEAMVESVPLDYVGFRIPNLFVIGYGLDYNQAGRHLRGIYIREVPQVAAAGRAG